MGCIAITDELTRVLYEQSAEAHGVPHNWDGLDAEERKKWRGVLGAIIGDDAQAPPFG